MNTQTISDDELVRELTAPLHVSELQTFTGTENYYRHSLRRSMLYTDGVNYFAERAQAYWFLDIVATEFYQLQSVSPFLTITMTVKNRKAKILVTDGNSRKLKAKNITYTDCPVGEWKFFMTDNVLMVPSEY